MEKVKQARIEPIYVRIVIPSDDGESFHIENLTHAEALKKYPKNFVIQSKPMNPVKIALVGWSGAGKTYACRNLNPESTVFLNIEDKPLPFPGKFRVWSPSSVYKEIPDVKMASTKVVSEFDKAFETAAKLVSIETIVIDSFSAYQSLYELACKQKLKGWDVYSQFKEGIDTLMTKIKYCEKNIIMLAHYEHVGNEGRKMKAIKVQGKVHEGLIEAHFSVVLWAEKILNMENKVEYMIRTASAIDDSAKCPPHLFTEDYIDNDINHIINIIKNESENN